MFEKRIFPVLAGALLATGGFAFAQSSIPHVNTSAAAGEKAVATYFTEDSVGDAELGKLGLQKSKNAAVRQLASAMVRDHTRTASDGMRVAQALGDAEVQWKPDASAQIDLTALSRYNGSDFDREYVKALVKAHQTDISAIRDSQEFTSNSELKRYLQDVLSVDQHHLQMAQAAQSKV